MGGGFRNISERFYLIMKFANILKFKNYFRGEIKAFRDWKIVLLGFVVLLVVVLSVDAYVFLKYQKELAQPAVSAGQVKFVTIDRTALQKAIDWLNIKEKKFNENLVAPKINDPSI
jgi:hypothetical protein